jgi:hypothetical protein
MNYLKSVYVHDMIGDEMTSPSRKHGDTPLAFKVKN